MATHVFQGRWRAVQAGYERARTGYLLRDVVIFAAGAEALHTLRHVWWAVAGMLPASSPWLPDITITHGINTFSIVVNGLITAGLLYWAHRLKK